MAASRFAKVSAEKREKTFIIEQQHCTCKATWVKRRFSKEYLNGEIDNFEQFK